VVGCDVWGRRAVMLFVSSSGHGKRTKLDLFKRQNRGGQGVRGMKITAARGGVVACVKAYRRFTRGAAGTSVVYFAIAANPVASVRDAVLAATARAMGKRLVIHLRGGRYDEFYRSSNWMLTPAPAATTFFIWRPFPHCSVKS